MTLNTAERFQRWFEYEKDCQAKVLDSLTAVPRAEPPLPPMQRAIDLLSHLVAARCLWLFRLGGAPEPPREMFPVGRSIERVQFEVDAMQREWSAYLAQLSEEAIGRQFEYQSLEGEWYRSTVEDILTQLFGHAWYHRGQIALLLRSCGAEPPVTDFVFWTRTPIDPTALQR